MPKRRKKSSTRDKGFLDDEARFLDDLEAKPKGTKAKSKKVTAETIKVAVLAAINGGAAVIAAYWHPNKGFEVYGLGSKYIAKLKEADSMGWTLDLEEDMDSRFGADFDTYASGCITIEVANHSPEAIAEWAEKTIMLFHSSSVRMTITEGG